MVKKECLLDLVKKLIEQASYQLRRQTLPTARPWRRHPGWPGPGQSAPAADPLDEYPMQELKEFNGKKPQATFAAVSSLLSLVSLLIKDVEVLCMADPVDEYPGSGWECSNLDGRGQLQVGLRRADAVRGSGPREIKGIS